MYFDNDPYEDPGGEPKDNPIEIVDAIGIALIIVIVFLVLYNLFLIYILPHLLTSPV